ncbi:MAG: LacI family DNA-binding transcriptional regulator [Caldilineales bacterium]
MPVRLKDIAAQLDLSVTTVSRALAGYSDVSPQTRERVLATAAAMGYVPDATAQRLQKQRTNTIGFIVPTFGPRFSDPFFSELMAGIGNEAARRNYDVLISTVAPGPEESEVYNRHIKSRRVDGMLVVRTRRDDPRISKLLEAGLPFVAFGRTETSSGYPWIDTDGATGVELAVQHLIALGHRNIGFVRSPEFLMFSALRWDAFRQVMSANDLTVNPQWVLHGDLTQGTGKALTGRLLGMGQRPTALLYDNDLMALGGMARCRKEAWLPAATFRLSVLTTSGQPSMLIPR